MIGWKLVWDRDPIAKQKYQNQWLVLAFVREGGLGLDCRQKTVVISCDFGYVEDQMP